MKWIRTLSICLLVASLTTAAISVCQLVHYNQEEQRTDLLQAELAAVYASTPESVETEVPVTASQKSQEDRSQADMPGAIAENANAKPAPDAVLSNAESLLTGDIPVQPGTSATGGLAALNARNPDCVAWITIEGTVIDYPVMHKPDRIDYYLHRDFNGKESSAGSLYISEICDPIASDNVLIYGHNMNSGKMFAALTKYKERSFYEDHRHIRFETLEGAHVYEVIFALTTPVYTGVDFEYYSFATARSEAEFDAYIAQCAQRALYDTGLSASYGDKLLTLSTCEYSQKNGRMLVVAKRMDE